MIAETPHAPAEEEMPRTEFGRPDGDASVRCRIPVVGLGASAGGLATFKTFLTVLPSEAGMAYVLIQHLDPAYPTMMADLLASHTAMKVLLAIDGAPIAPNHVYVIPAGVYLSVKDGALHLSEPRERHGTRMPFDFFLESLADECGARAMCVILSGMGSDGSLGAKVVKDKGGLVIAQEPTDAIFDVMPRSAISTNCVDLVLPLLDIPQALLDYCRHDGVVSTGSAGRMGARVASGMADLHEAELNEIIALVSAVTPHDFSSYKRGTLLRRLKRRMAMAGIADWQTYIAMLRANPAEIQEVAEDLLINVTQFFRDGIVFETLAQTTIRDLVQRETPDGSLRVWVPGCSTGEEAYSLAMLFLEEIQGAKRNIKFQFFASDVDADAVAFARVGVYPETIEADITPVRLSRFFTKEDHSYRATPELRNAVVFTIHDVLADPPFSRLDFISCRNVFIYLQPEAQSKVIDLFHFALRSNGALLLGRTETADNVAGLFEPLSRELRLYRKIYGVRQPGAQVPSFRTDAGRQMLVRTPKSIASRPAPPLGEVARQLLLDAYAPPSVLINVRREGLYYFGAVDRYLHIASGEASNDILNMAREGLRANLRAVIQRARKDNARTLISGARLRGNSASTKVNICVQPASHEDKTLFLVSFTEEADQHAPPSVAQEAGEEGSRVTELERELDATRTDLHEALRDLEITHEEHTALYEEAMSVNEEFQSTNEELETSKEELQSLNEELVALNSQLQETVERQRATFNDLQNILNSSDVATIFLDRYLKVCFYTPAATSLFNIIRSDIGRPLAHLTRMFSDDNLLSDAHMVLTNSAPLRREVTTDTGEWRIRRILPYRDGNHTEGVVITFSDISELKAIERELEAERDYSASIIATVRQPLIVVDEEMRVESASRAFYQMFAVQPGDTIGRHFTEAVGGLNNPALDRFLVTVQAGGKAIADQEIEVEVAALGRRVLLINATDIRKETTARRKILVSINDVTESRRKREALAAAKLEAERANQGKSRFLAAASHDLRQPLQTISLLQALLADRITDASILKLVERLDRTATAMAGILDQLLDINQLESGTISAQISEFPIAEVLEPLRTEFAYHTENRGLGWRVVSCGLTVRSDRRLLELMIRNLLSNAVKYTTAGRVLLGCRGHGTNVRIEVWDTGIGIPAEELEAIFEEFRQLDNPARERAKGLGLGLSIVQRLAGLLNHQITVRSSRGKGSVFAIEVPLGRSAQADPAHIHQTKERDAVPLGGTLLVIEDDPYVREALKLALEGEGYQVWDAADGPSALKLAEQGARPDLVIADYNLPNGFTGLQAVTRLQEILDHQVEVIVLTGDISSETSQEIASCGYACVSKPAHMRELVGLIRRLLVKRSRADAQRVSHTESGPLFQRNEG